MRRVCTVCNKPKNAKSFAYKNKANGRRHPHCRKCQKLYRDSYYRSNATQEKENAVKGRTIRERSHFESMVREKLKPCFDCSSKEPPWAMQFDHRDGTSKVDCVTVLVHNGASWARIKAEIDKCDVVCANCHFKRTFSRRTKLGDFARYAGIMEEVESYLGVCLVTGTLPPPKRPISVQF